MSIFTHQCHTGNTDGNFFYQSPWDSVCTYVYIHNPTACSLNTPAQKHLSFPKHNSIYNQCAFKKCNFTQTWIFFFFLMFLLHLRKRKKKHQPNLSADSIPMWNLFMPKGWLYSTSFSFPLNTPKRLFIMQANLLNASSRISLPLLVISYHMNGFWTGHDVPLWSRWSTGTAA